MERRVFGRVLVDSTVLIALGLLLGAALGLVYSAVQPRTYAATARVMVVADRDEKVEAFGDLATTYLADQRVRSYRSLLTSRTLMDRTVTVHGLPTTATDLQKRTTITSPKNTSLIDITVTAPSGQLAADYANGIAQEFVAASAQLEREVAIHSTVVRAAEAPSRPAHPQTARNVINTALAFGVLTAAISVFRAWRNPKLVYLRGVSSIGGLPVIGCAAIGSAGHRPARWSSRSHQNKASGDIRRIAEHLVAREHLHPHDDVEIRSRSESLREVLGEKLSRRLADMAVATSTDGRNERLEVKGIKKEGAVAAPAAPGIYIGVIPAATRWQDALAFTDELRGESGRAVLVIADGGRR